MMSAQSQRTVDQLRETLLSNWEGDTPSECLELAEKADSSTPDNRKKLCPNCETTRVIAKPGWKDIPNKIHTEYRCSTCGEHFDRPLPPRAGPPAWWGPAAGGLEVDR